MKPTFVLDLLVQFDFKHTGLLSEQLWWRQWYTPPEFVEIEHRNPLEVPTKPLNR